MIELSHIKLAYGRRTLIEDATALLHEGSITALLGRNGTGKSTLLRAMASLGSVQEGAILYGGRPLAELSSVELAQSIAFVNTERVDVEAMTARELVALGRAPYTDWMGRLTAEDCAVVARAIEVVGIEELADRYVDTLSDGECQRVMIARALAQATPIILLDEPTSFLDMPNRYELCHLLADLAHKENKCIIFSTHELDIAKSVCDTIALIDSPALHHYPTEEMINSGYIEKLFKIRYER